MGEEMAGMPTPGNASVYLDRIDQAANIVEDVSINLRDLLVQMRNLKLVRQDAYDAVYLLRRDLGRAVAILDGGYPTPRTSIFHNDNEGNEGIASMLAREADEAEARADAEERGEERPMPGQRAKRIDEGV